MGKKSDDFHLEIRDIKMIAKKGEPVEFDIMKAYNLKAALDHYRGIIIDQGLALYQQLNYALIQLGVDPPNFKEDRFMDLRKLWSDELKKTKYKKTTKKLRRRVFVSIHKRNKYAHGKLSFMNNRPVFTYYDDGRKIEETLSIDKINGDLDYVRSTLEDLRKINHKLSLEKTPR